MKLQVKKAEMINKLQVLTHTADPKRVTSKKSVGAKPREYVDPSTRNKDVLGTCNR